MEQPERKKEPQDRYGQRLGEIRRASLVTLREMAAHLGLTPRELSDVEQGRAQPLGAAALGLFLDRLACSAQLRVVYAAALHKLTADWIGVDFERAAHISQAMEAVLRFLRDKPRGWLGTMACPRCGDAAQVAKAAGNGHARFRCTRAGCLAFIQ